MTRRRFVRFATLASAALAATGGAATWARAAGGGNGRRRFPVSDHCDGERFFNLGGVAAGRSLAEVLRWKMTSRPARWPRRVDDLVTPRLPARVVPGEVAATFVGHATFLLQFAGVDRNVNVLVDPVWSERASPVSWAGPRRVRAPGLAWEQLPPVALVLVSHGHYDHLDLPTLQRLEARDQPLFVVPLGHGDLLRARGLTRVEELDWWQGLDNAAGTGLRVTLTPAQHWTSRRAVDRNRALWGGFFLDGGGSDPARAAGVPPVWFAGDTGYYGPHPVAVRQRLGAPALALLPIGAYAPRWFMAEAHMNPAEAVRVHRDVGARRSVGMHFGTFPLTDEPMDEPAAWFTRERAAQGLSEDTCRTLGFGETRTFSGRA